MKKCPYCSEQIQDEAVFCRFCNKNLKKNKIGCGGLLLILFVIGIIGNAIHPNEDKTTSSNTITSTQQFTDECNINTLFDNAGQYTSKPIKDCLYKLERMEVRKILPEGFLIGNYRNEQYLIDDSNFDVESGNLAFLYKDGMGEDVGGPDSDKGGYPLNSDYAYYVGDYTYTTSKGELKKLYAFKYYAGENNDFTGVGKYYLDKQSAVKFAEDIIKDKLLAPSTAIFPDTINVVAYMGMGKWSVGSYVDSQNAFGAMLRQYYDIDFYYDNEAQKPEVIDCDWREGLNKTPC